MIHPLVMAAMAHGAPILTLSGHSVVANTSGSQASARIKIDSDGKVYESVNLAAWVQVDTVDDWVRPANAAPGSFETRYTNLTVDALASATAAEDIWHPMSSGDFILEQTDNTPAFGGNISIVDIEIRSGSSGSAEVSASYSLTADRSD